MRALPRIVQRFVLAATVGAFCSATCATHSLAEKAGGVLRIFQYDSPASMSIHEEALNSAQNPMMAVFNNLVIFRQDEPPKPKEKHTCALCGPHDVGGGRT